MSFGANNCSTYMSVRNDAKNLQPVNTAGVVQAGNNAPGGPAGAAPAVGNVASPRLATPGSTFVFPPVTSPRVATPNTAGTQLLSNPSVVTPRTPAFGTNNFCSTFAIVRNDEKNLQAASKGGVVQTGSNAPGGPAGPAPAVGNLAAPRLATPGSTFAFAPLMTSPRLAAPSTAETQQLVNTDKHPSLVTPRTPAEDRSMTSTEELRSATSPRTADFREATATRDAQLAGEALPNVRPVFVAPVSCNTRDVGVGTDVVATRSIGVGSQSVTVKDAEVMCVLLEGEKEVVAAAAVGVASTGKDGRANGPERVALATSPQSPDKDVPLTPRSAGKEPERRFPSIGQKAVAVTPRALACSGRPVTADALRTIREFVNAAIASGVTGFRREFLDLKLHPPTNFTTVAFSANPQRNRYRDVVCIDSTRVILKLNVPPDTDYIHANWVKMENSEKTFIAAQAPLDLTIGDFWRLCFQENVATIVALCNVIECGRKKSTQYWPLVAGERVTYGCISVFNKQVSEQERLFSYTLEVSRNGFPRPLGVRLVHMSEWPDRGVPEYAFCILRLLRKIDKNAPCVIHCSAGIGRTGTAIAIDTIIQRLFKGIPTTAKSVVQELRTKRFCSVQTEAQYVFIASAVLTYIMAKMPALFQRRVDSFLDEVKKAALV